MATKESLMKKLTDRVGKGAEAVTKVVGAKPMVDYVSSKMAKMKVGKDAKKFVEDKTSLGQAAASAATTASLLTGGAALGLKLGGKLAMRGAVKGLTGNKAALKVMAREVKKRVMPSLDRVGMKANMASAKAAGAAKGVMKNGIKSDFLGNTIKPADIANRTGIIKGAVKGAKNDVVKLKPYTKKSWWRDMN